MFTRPKVALDEVTIGLWVLAKERSKSALRVIHVTRLDPDLDAGSDPTASFRSRAIDTYDIHRRILDGKIALETAKALAAKSDTAGAQEVLTKFLETRKTWKLPSSDGVATMHVGPLERRARELLAEIGKDAKGTKRGG